MRILQYIILASALFVPQTVYSQRRISSIRSVDFNNFTYPALWTKKPFTLKNGRYEFEHDHCFTEYALKSVNYVDLTGDGEKDAVVETTDFNRVRLLIFDKLFLRLHDTK